MASLSPVWRISDWATETGFGMIVTDYLWKKEEEERFYFPSWTEAMGIFINTDWYCDESSSASVKEK